MNVMKREQSRRTPKPPASGNEPKTYTAKGIRDEVESLREVLMEVRAVAKRMETRKMQSITDRSKALKRLKEALDAWHSAIRDAYHSELKATLERAEEGAADMAHGPKDV